MTPLTPLDFIHDDIGHGCFALDLDGKVQSYIPAIRDHLITRGILTKDAHGLWHLAWHGFDLAREQAADLSCCDFCASQPVLWLIPCETFQMPIVDGGPDMMSNGDWAACDLCGMSISRDRRNDLLYRALRHQPEETKNAPPAIQAELQQFKRRLHETFWRHYKGGALRIV